MEIPASLTLLVVGSGGREHAIVKKCLESPHTGRVIAAPGNGGIAAEVETFPIAADAVDALVALAREQAVDLVIVGPEVPLTLGLADALEDAGIAVYGPRAAGARLEGSKVFCKAFFERHQIPTARYAAFSELAPALAYLEQNPAPIVIKASGLAAGKGVIMAETGETAKEALREILTEGRFGDSGSEVVIEEWLRGEEASIHIVTSGVDAVILPSSQDHKRIGEGDTGLNTGGMGAYAPAPVVTPELLERINTEVVQPTLEGLKKDGIDYRGTLYAGIMVTPEGPKMLEYNVRFGDPETQVLMAMIESDLVPVFWAVARGLPIPRPFRVRDGAAMVVVLAAEGYPEGYRKGDTIHLPSEVPAGVSVVHAGTALRKDGTICTAGGRVLGVSAAAETLEAAAKRAYATCDAIQFEGKTLRRDIGHRAFARNAPGSD